MSTLYINGLAASETRSMSESEKGLVKTLRRYE